MRTFWSRGLILLFVLSVVSPPASAGTSREPEQLSVRAFMSTLWRGVSQLIPLIGKSSGTMDPDGKPLPPPSGAPEQGDSSGTMDPDGRM